MTRIFALRAVVPALALAACAVPGSDENFGPQPITPTEQFAIEVRQTPEELAITPSPHGLTMQQASALAALAERWRDGGGDPVTVRAPATGGGTAQAVAAALSDFGVPASMIVLQGYDGRGADAPVLVGFNRYTAAGPRCAETWTHVDATFHSRASGNFGCSITANIAAQVANARDFTTPRDMTAADPVRRQTALGLYRQGQPSHATRSPDERTTISDVARQQ